MAHGTAIRLFFGGEKMHKIKIPDIISEIITRLEENGFAAYVVGGCVRDSIIGRAVNDWDVCTAAVPDEVRRSLPDFKVIDTGIEHGTVTAVKSKTVCEITTFRTESGYNDHRHPTAVSFSRNIEADLKRRDFTMNAIAYSPTRGTVDNFGGFSDIEHRLIRCVGEAEKRFSEDALRIMRALRFSSQLGFEIEKNTADAICKQANTLSKIAKERIRHELCGLLMGNSPGNVLRKFECVFREVFTDARVLDDWDYKIRIVDNSPFEISVRMAHILDGIPASEAKDLLAEMRFDRKTSDKVVFLLQNRNFKFSESVVLLKQTVSDFGYENTFLLLDFLGASNKIRDRLSEIKAESPPLWIRDLEIGGADILALGVTDGRKVGTLLNQALKAVISGKCENTQEKLIDFIKKNIQ